MLRRLKSFRLFLILFIFLIAVPLSGATCDKLVDRGVGDGTGEGGAAAPPEMVIVPAGTFIMGRTDRGDDATYGNSDEIPRHNVYLDSYQIGKYEVTNGEYAEILNWAKSQGYIDTYNSSTVTSYGQELLDFDDSDCQISYSSGEFVVEGRDGYSIADHPVVEVSWYGSAVYCNWLSEANGLTPAYNTSAWTCDFTKNGYRLPTEAEWERAAAWSGSEHWIYGYQGNTFSQTKVNAYTNGHANPLGLSSYPWTSPIGYYNGVNAGTLDSPSPVGCYDMSGNVWEWCNDWYGSAYYNSSSENNPTGANPGLYRVLRGGSWGSGRDGLRSADRGRGSPTYAGYVFGFRVSRN
ncbi:formylglycine-generating enzyme family protein [Candidatus Hydrogenedentota bacterium]